MTRRRKRYGKHNAFEILLDQKLQSLLVQDHKNRITLRHFIPKQLEKDRFGNSFKMKSFLMSSTEIKGIVTDCLALKYQGHVGEKDRWQFENNYDKLFEEFKSKFNTEQKNNYSRIDWHRLTEKGLLKQKYDKLQGFSLDQYKGSIEIRLMNERLKVIKWVKELEEPSIFPKRKKPISEEKKKQQQQEEEETSSEEDSNAHASTCQCEECNPLSQSSQSMTRKNSNLSESDQKNEYNTELTMSINPKKDDIEIDSLTKDTNNLNAIKQNHSKNSKQDYTDFSLFDEEIKEDEYALYGGLKFDKGLKYYKF